MGSPTPDEVQKLDSFGQDIMASDFASQSRPCGNLESRFRDVGADALDLLKQVLQFSPDNRCNAEQALAHLLLTETRDPDTEETATVHVDLEFDDAGRIAEPVLRKMFAREALRAQNGRQSRA